MGRGVQHKKKRTTTSSPWAPFAVGTRVSVCLTDMGPHRRYQGCHVFGTVDGAAPGGQRVVLFDDDLDDLPSVCTVAASHLQLASESSSAGGPWKVGDPVHVLEGNGWWEATVVVVGARACKVRWRYEYNHDDEEWVSVKRMRRANK